MKKTITALLICVLLTMLTACRLSSKYETLDVDLPFEPAAAYRVITVDESGAPVAGVTVQFCSDQICTTGETDADGIAVFDSPEGIYTVHVGSVPEGYAEDETEYPVPGKYGDVTITLKTAGD